MLPRILGSITHSNNSCTYPRYHRNIYLEHFEKERGSHGGEVFGGEIGPVSGDEVGTVIAQNGCVDLLGHLVKPDAVGHRDRRHQ